MSNAPKPSPLWRGFCTAGIILIVILICTGNTIFHYLAFLFVIFVCWAIAAAEEEELLGTEEDFQRHERELEEDELDENRNP